jgi:type II secretory ATPase GspE/PulE/Tfp pilus assembly ATPase PilB-like protein
VPLNDDYVVDILLEAGLINRSQVQETRETAEGGNVSDALVKAGLITHEDISRTLAANSGMEFVSLAQVTVPPNITGILTPMDARRYQAIPIAERDDTVTIAIADPMAFETFDSLSFLLKRQVEFVCTTPEQLEQALTQYYGPPEGEGATGEGFSLDEDGTGEGDAPIIKMVTTLLLEAYKIKASDIHLEPLERSFRVRFRIDGVLQEMQSPPKKLQAAILSRLKIMTGTMSIAEKRLPQDGRIQVKIGKAAVDLRVSTIPTVHGESVVMRILDKSSLVLGLPELGFLSDDQAQFEQLISLPDGIVLVTGPTGSGKTTTLYACLNYINKPDRKLITVEDPVEYQMSGINQVQVNADIGMTFPAALRSMLRQAPNIIMIGEIRDAETASIAINASLTGHLVLSTLHTNDAPSAIPRLVDIGVQPFLVSSSVRAAIAQRLVRRLCPKCKEPTELSEYELHTLGLEPSQMAGAKPMKPVGCDACRGRGYKGRMGIFEMFLIDDEVRHMINNNASTIALRQRARELGMRTLREDGVRKVLAGLTTAEEVITTTMTDLA